MKISQERIERRWAVIRRRDLGIVFEELAAERFGGRPWEGRLWGAIKRMKNLREGVDYTVLSVNGRRRRFVTRRCARMLDRWWQRHWAEEASPLEPVERDRPAFAEVGSILN